MTPGISENLTANMQRVVAEHNKINDQETSEEEPELIAIIKSTKKKRTGEKRQRNQRCKRAKGKKKIFQETRQPTPIDRDLCRFSIGREARVMKTER